MSMLKITTERTEKVLLSTLASGEVFCNPGECAYGMVTGGGSTGLSYVWLHSGLFVQNTTDRYVTRVVAEMKVQ